MLMHRYAVCCSASALIMLFPPGSGLAQQQPSTGTAPQVAHADPFSGLQPLSSDQARIVFYREAYFVGAMLDARVRIDGKVVAWVDSGTAVYADHAAGTLSISIDSPMDFGSTKFALTVEPGKYYFIPIVAQTMAGAVGAALNASRHVDRYCGGGWCADVVDSSQALSILGKLAISPPNPDADRSFPGL
jgi:hypothetical protein